MPTSASAAFEIQVQRATSLQANDAISLIEEYYAAADVVARDGRETILELLAGPQSAIWVAYAGREPAGCILYRRLPRLGAAAELKRLYVRPAFRNRGIASQLLRAAESFAAQQNASWLYLDTKDDLRRAIAFYQLHGYKPCERYNDNPQATIFLRKKLPGGIAIRSFLPGDEQAFQALNEAWIGKHFRLEDKDRETLGDPERHILSQGGQIFFALRDEVPVGCCALLALENGDFEVAKMTVSEAHRGQGIGRKLLAHVIEYARARSIKRLYLETNASLKDAIHLYEAMGFQRLPPERVQPSAYSRADVYMEQVLSGPAG